VPGFITERWAWLWERQLFYVVTGAVLMFAVSALDYRWFTKFYFYIYGLMLVLLLVVMFVGASEPGVSRWLWIPVPVFGSLSILPLLSRNAVVFELL